MAQHIKAQAAQEAFNSNVRIMRKAQKSYFVARRQGGDKAKPWLIESKKYEALVDKYLNNNDPNQGKLKM